MARPRQADIDDRLLAAARSLLASTDYEKITMEAIAAEAGVSKPALYLRYRSRAHLVFAATVQTSVLPDMPDLGGLHQDLVFALQMLAASLEASPRPLMAEQFATCILDPDFSREVNERVHKPVLDAVEAIWRRAVERGEISPELDGARTLVDLSCAVVMRIVYLHEHLTDEQLATMVDQFISGATRGAPG